MKAIKETVIEADTCCTILCAGPVGSGKSSLGLHGYEIVDPDAMSMDNVAMTVSDLAKATRILKEEPGSFVNYDEGNVNRRNATTKFNKKFIDLLFNIRGLNGILWINNPSVAQMDSVLVEEALINVFVFINENRQSYLWITRDGMMRLYRKYGDLGYETLREHGAEVAEFEGWFKAYTNPFWKEYTQVKKDRMREKVDEFSDEFGGGQRWSMHAAAKKMGVHYNTLHKYLTLMVEDKSLRAGAQGASGRFRLNESDLEDVQSYIEAAHKKHATRARRLALKRNRT
ncbi:MAG: hypothetical protein LC650_01945 [Actinobacteria bacterium]|nr:hypothetical protein [Actinomycetota bacterium]